MQKKTNMKTNFNNLAIENAKNKTTMKNNFHNLAIEKCKKYKYEK